MIDYAKASTNIQRELSTYITENRLKSLVLGISGGIDSALCAVLAQPVCDSLKIPLIGRSIPIESNKIDEIKRANKIGKAFCHNFTESDMDCLYLEHKNWFNIRIEREYDRIRAGNIKARLRMMYLYDLAGERQGMVLSTDNFTELSIGFWTIHGDVGDYGMIQNLWKTEVYEMANFYINKWQQEAANEKLEEKKEKIILKIEALNDCIHAVPTDGLGITDSDLDQLKASSYDEVDKILKEYLELKRRFNTNAYYYGRTPNGIQRELSEMERHPVIARHLKTHFKRNNPYNIPREIICG